MSSINFISLCESILKEQLLAEAIRAHLVDISRQADEARADRANSDEPETKAEALQILRVLKFSLLEELNADAPEKNKITTDEEFDSTIEKLIINRDMEGLRHLKTSIIGPLKR